MSNNFLTSETFKMSSSLIPGPKKNYVISSFIIALPGGVNIALIETKTKSENIKDNTGEVVDLLSMTFKYKAFEDENDSAQELLITHPKIYGFPVQVVIIVEDIWGGGTSTVKDVAL